MSTAHGVRFDRLCRAVGVRVPVPEYKFALAIGRDWRFDWAWPDRRVALEVEGGTWHVGRHQRRGGFIEDMAKYNAAALDGWIVLRVIPETLTQPDTFAMIRRALLLRAGV